MRAFNVETAQARLLRRLRRSASGPQHAAARRRGSAEPGSPSHLHAPALARPQAIDAAKDPKLAAIRLTWWRDTLSRALSDEGKPPPHPVAKALRAVRFCALCIPAALDSAGAPATRPTLAASAARRGG